MAAVERRVRDRNAQLGVPRGRARRSRFDRIVMHR
jgi:hypothetical protein